MTAAVTNLLSKARSWREVATTWAAYVATIALLGVAAQSRSLWKAALGAALLVSVAWVLHKRLLRLRSEDTRKFFVISLVIVVAGAAMVLLWFVGNKHGVRGFFGIVTFYFGVGQLIGTLRAWERRPTRLASMVLAVCATAFGVGLVVVTLESASWAIGLLVAGVLLAPVALTLLTDDALDWIAKKDKESRTAGTALKVRRFRLAVGVAIFEAGLLGLVAAGASVRYAVLIALVISTLIGVIASDTDADIIVVLIAVALVWSFAPREVSPPASTDPKTGEPALVALGDSFMSGEGAQRFFEGTNTRGENECRRAPTAYAVQVLKKKGAAIPDKVVFLACSGAKAEQIYKTPQYQNEPIGGSARIVDGEEVRGLNQLEQLENLRRSVDFDIALVIVSIGGNDALFGTIGRSCVGPGDCSELGGFWLEDLKAVGKKLDDTYSAIRNSVGDGVDVLVVPYPVPLDDDGCSWSLLTAHEHRFIHGYTLELNSVVRRAALKAGFHYLADIEDALERKDLRICDGPAGKIGVNFLAANPIVGVMQQRVSPVNWFHNSFHPNHRGHAEMAEVLAQWIRCHPEPGRALDPTCELGPTYKPDGGEVASITGIMGRNFKHCAELGAGLPSCRSSTGHWTTAQAARLVWYGAIPLLLVAGGAWILWLQLLAAQAHRRRGRPRSQHRRFPRVPRLD